MMFCMISSFPLISVGDGHLFESVLACLVPFLAFLSCLACQEPTKKKLKTFKNALVPARSSLIILLFNIRRCDTTESHGLLGL